MKSPCAKQSCAPAPAPCAPAPGPPLQQPTRARPAAGTLAPSAGRHGCGLHCKQRLLNAALIVFYVRAPDVTGASRNGGRMGDSPCRRGRAPAASSPVKWAVAPLCHAGTAGHCTGGPCRAGVWFSTLVPRVPGAGRGAGQGRGPVGPSVPQNVRGHCGRTCP